MQRDLRSDFLGKFLGESSFADVTNELLINRPNKVLSQVPLEVRVRVYTMESIFAENQTKDLIELLAPRRFTGDEARISQFITAMKYNIQARHPDWKVKP